MTARRQGPVNRSLPADPSPGDGVSVATMAEAMAPKPAGGNRLTSPASARQKVDRADAVALRRE